MADEKMLATLLWLSPTAGDLLRSISKVTRGKVPCGTADLAKSLQDAAAEPQCEGLLADAKLRQAFAKKLGASKLKEISHGSAAELAEVMTPVLKEEVDKIKKEAADLAKKLNDKDLSLAGIEKALKPTPLGEAVKRDWAVWHAVGNAHDAKSLPQLQAGALKERISLLAVCGKESVLQKFVLAMHVLENVESYVAWELLIPGSQPPKAGQGMKKPFDKDATKEVALRRVLGNALPQETATTAATTAGGGKIRDVLDKLAATAKKEAVIPLYTPPAAPAEPKAKKEKDAGEGKKGDKADAKPAAAAAGGKGATMDGFSGLHSATATQELQWHLLRYRMTPGTSLSSAQPKNLTPGGGAASSGGAGGSSGCKAVAAPKGFAGVWSPVQGDCLPPGHTMYSWKHEKAAGMDEGFATTWNPVGASPCPPGHTPDTWINRVIGGATDTSSPSKEGKKEKKEKPAKAEKAGFAAPKAKAAAAPAAAGNVPADGTVEAAMGKIDLRVGRIETAECVPDSDKLFLLSVNIGDPEPRQVITGLQKYYKASDLQGRIVVVYCNIKPGKLAGYESQAMVLAGSKGKETDNAVVEVLDPPAGSQPGDKIMAGSLECGCISAGVNVKNTSKFWKEVQPLLLVNGSKEAMFNGNVLKVGGKSVTVKTLGDGATIS